MNYNKIFNIIAVSLVLFVIFLGICLFFYNCVRGRKKVEDCYAVKEDKILEVYDV